MITKKAKKNTAKLIQTSKECVNGKWVSVGFYEDTKGRITSKILKK